MRHLLNGFQVFFPVLTIFSLSCLSPAYGRKLDGRTGFGMTIHPFHTTPSLSMRHHMSDHQSAVVLFGFDTGSNNVLVLGGKFYQAAHIEENMNVYVGLGGFLISDKSTGTTSSGIELDGFFGAEFFFTGLPNLGIQFETGIAMRTLGGVSFASTGSGFLGGGIHYYF